MEVWALSYIADKSLVRSVYKLFSLNVDGPFASSCLESRDDLKGIRAGADISLREYAVQSLRHSIGWIDSAGRLIDGRYPGIRQLIDGFKLIKLRKSSPSPASQSFLSLETSPTIPEPQALNKPETLELKNISRETGVVISNSHGENPANNGTDKAFPGNDNGISPTENSKTRIISASLYDGTLVVPNFQRCQRMSMGVGLDLSKILRIISQWRTQTREILDRGQRGMSLLIHVLDSRDPTLVPFELFRRGDGRVEQTMARYKLRQTSDTSYIKVELEHPEFPNERALQLWRGYAVCTFKRGLKNHVGTLDEDGVLQTSEQPTIHEALHDLKKPLRVSSTALKEIHMDMTNAAARYSPLEPTDNEKAEERLETKPEKKQEKDYKDDDNKCPAHRKHRSVFMSASIHDGSLVVPSAKLCAKMSTGVGKSFSDFLRIISQWRTQNRHSSDLGQDMIFVYPKHTATSFNILTLGSDIQTLRSKISALPSSHGSLRQQPMSRFRLFHSPGTTDSSYVNCECECTDRTHSIKKLQDLIDTFERGLRNHVGVVDETGSLRRSEPSTAPEVLNDREASVRRKDTIPSRVRYTPPKPTDNEKPETKLERKPDKIAENVQEISLHDQIASTMTLAGALFEISIMLSEEMSHALAQRDDSTSSTHSHSNLINEPNPVFRTMKNGEIDIDAVQDAMAEFRTQLRDHQDKAQILARVCRRWKEELETRYPMVKRKSVAHNDVDELLSPRSGLSTMTESVPKRSTTSETDKQNLTAKIRYMGGRSELKPISRMANHKGGEKTPAEPRTTDARSKSTSTTTLDESKEDGQPNKQQDEFSSDRDGKQPYSSSSSGRNNGRSKNDDGFSIFAW